MRSLTETLNCFSCSHMASNFTKEFLVEGKAKDRAKNLLYFIWVQLLVMLILRFYSASIFFFLRFQDPDIFVLCKLSDVFLLFKWQARVTLGKPSLSQNLPQHWDLRNRRECRDNFSVKLYAWFAQRGALFFFFNSTASCITPRELCTAASQPCHWDPPHPLLPPHIGW